MTATFTSSYSVRPPSIHSMYKHLSTVGSQQYICNNRGNQYMAGHRQLVKMSELEVPYIIDHRMKAMLDASRNGDFQAAKQIFDQEVSKGAVVADLINATDSRGRTVAHFAAEHDDIVVIEWLYANGANLFSRDDSNKSPIETTVIVDAKLRKKKKSESEVLPFLKSVVLNPVQQMFFIECGESTKSVTGIADLAKLTVAQISERFPYHNNLQAVHLFAMDDRLDELKFVHGLGVDMTAEDDDGNTALHFVKSARVATFLITECGLDVNHQNTSDGYAPLHSIIERIAMVDIDDGESVAIIDVFVVSGADFSIQADSDGMGITEFALELLGMEPVVEACLKGKGSISGESFDAYLAQLDADHDSDSDVSVASHDDKVIGENGEEDSDDEQSSDGDDQETGDVLDAINEESQGSGEDDDDANFFSIRK